MEVESDTEDKEQPDQEDPIEDEEEIKEDKSPGYSMAQEYQTKRMQDYTSIQNEMIDNLQIGHFTLISELLDSNTDNQEVFFGRKELTNFIQEKLIKDDIIDLLENTESAMVLKLFV